MRLLNESARCCRRVFVRTSGLFAGPAAEWRVIATSLPAERGTILWHAVVLSALTAIAWSLGVAWAPMHPGAPLPFVLSVITTFLLCMAAVAMLAGSVAVLLPMYGRPRDWLRAWAVGTYSATPVLLSGVLLVVPVLVIAIVIALPYACYLLFLGLQEVLGVTRGDAAEFTAASLLAMVLASVVFGGLLSAIGAI